MSTRNANLAGNQRAPVSHHLNAGTAIDASQDKRMTMLLHRMIDTLDRGMGVNQRQR